MFNAQIVKVLLAVAILLVGYKMLLRHGRRGWGGNHGVRPFAGFERFDDYESDEEDYEDAEVVGDDEEYEEEYQDEEYEEDEDEDDDEENEMVEQYSNALPASGPLPGAPMLSVATDLLPKSTPQVQSKFGEFAPKSLLGQNFLDAKKYIGVDTKGSSLRNANYDLRSSPAIPRKDVGPWSNSTIDAELFRKPLE